MNSISFRKIKGIIWEQDTAMKLLLYFLDNPTSEFYERQVAERTGTSVGAVNKYLKALANDGFLELVEKGNMNFYSLKKENPVVKHLKMSYNLSKPVVSELKEASRKLDVEIYLYGSVARGEDVEGSDWDVLVIGKAKLSEIEGKFNKIRKKFDKEIKLMTFSKSEWTKMEKNDKAFYERVERDKIELI